MKDWILEKAGDSVIQAWEGIGETFTDEMKSRKGGDLQSRCGMRAGTTLFTNMHNGDLAESVEGVSASDIKKYGYWPITKLMVRSLLPADRDQNLDPTIYISGHSQGGARASLVSMWLEKEDGVAYKTYEGGGLNTSHGASDFLHFSSFLAQVLAFAAGRAVRSTLTRNPNHASLKR